MAMKSNRLQVQKKIRDELGDRNQKAALTVTNKAKELTPVGTPESTGIPGYVGGRLRASVMPAPAQGGWHEGFSVGTNVQYAIYVHNGTYDFRSDFSNYENGEIFQTPSKGDSKKGMPARPFLVNGMNSSRAQLKEIYNRPAKD